MSKWVTLKAKSEAATKILNKYGSHFQIIYDGEYRDSEEGTVQLSSKEDLLNPDKCAFPKCIGLALDRIKNL